MVVRVIDLGRVHMAKDLEKGANFMKMLTPHVEKREFVFVEFFFKKMKNVIFYDFFYF